MSSSPKETSSESGILRVVKARTKDLGGFSVGRVLPWVHQRMIGPWVFFDHMGPAKFAPGIGINVRPHPHIHLSTVTYLFDGEIFHRDSLGNARPIRPGEINLMVAGKGITHSERESEDRKSKNRTMNGLQLWHALPRSVQDMEPEFHHYPKDTIPSLEVQGVPVRVLIGKAYGVVSPVKTFCDTLYIEARLSPGQSLTLPPSEERGLYVVEGEVEILDEVIFEHALAVLAPEPVTITATKESVVSLIGGESLESRHIFWNFVSTDLESIEKAKTQWKQGLFPKIPGDDSEFIPLPEESSN